VELYSKILSDIRRAASYLNLDNRPGLMRWRLCYLTAFLRDLPVQIAVGELSTRGWETCELKFCFCDLQDGNLYIGTSR
jgi:hypothetical protein